MTKWSFGVAVSATGAAIVYKLTSVDFSSSSFWLATLGVCLTQVGGMIINEPKNKWGKE